MKLEEHMQVVTDSFHQRQKKQEKALKQIWKGFDKEKKKLTDIVSYEFRKILEEIGPIKHSSKYCDETARVIEYGVSYNAQWNNFQIKIKKIKTSRGKIIGDYNECPHGFLDPEITGPPGIPDPRIKEFMKNYHIEVIIEPDNNCEHK